MEYNKSGKYYILDNLNFKLSKHTFLRIEKSSELPQLRLENNSINTKICTY